MCQDSLCVPFSLSQVTVHTPNKVNKHKQEASLSLAWTFDLEVVQMDMHKCISKFNDPNECATNLDPYPFLLRKKKKKKRE